MSKPYIPKEIEAKWRERWEKEKTFEVDLEKAQKPFYNLMMFPYPSGEGLHVGHVYTFGGADTYGHYMKMKGRDVFEPMGFDSFGIHSENYAIKVGKHPKQLIEETTKYFREEQLKKLGTLFDWRHEVITSDPNYYKWTQWLFTQLFKAGLAVRKKASVDWCPSCKTVLADEQVIAGKCERCGTEVIQKDLEQWFFKITEYAERLLNKLTEIDWSETTKTMQKNWIGKSTGAEIEFRVQNSELKIKVFTTRPDTVFGATFLVVAPEHQQIEQLITKDNKEKVSEYIKKAKSKSDVERTGEKTGLFIGSCAVNPFTKKEIPIYVADYVLTGYGTGAIMAVPAHDQRDYEFAKKYDLPIIPVISRSESDERSLTHVRDDKVSFKKAYEGDGTLINSGQFNGQKVQGAKDNIIKYIEESHLGSGKVNYHLRDWLISRQRYWSPPIPMIYCEHCAEEGKSWFSSPEAEERSKDQRYLTSDIVNLKSEVKGWYPVPQKDLPVELPEIEDYQPKGTGVSPLAGVPDFVKVKCPHCGKNARRETDVSDTFLDSSWYFLRYPSTDFDDRAFDEKLTKKWLPVDMYIGGNEHAVLHLMYSRFITMVLHDLGYIDFEEPFKKFRANALIIYQGGKMSKSKGNIVNPNDYMNTFGADTLKMYLLFIGPFDQGGEFNDRAIAGMFRFLNRLWTLVEELKDTHNTKVDEEINKKFQELVKNIDEGLANLKFNTSIAALMEFTNLLYKNKDKVNQEILKHFVLLLAPFAPFISEELWEELGGEFSVHEQKWPSFDPSALERKYVNVVIQINGKVRDRVEVETNIEEEELTRLVVAREKVKSYTQGKEIKKSIYVKGKILNLVV